MNQKKDTHEQQVLPHNEDENLLQDLASFKAEYEKLLSDKEELSEQLKVSHDNLLIAYAELENTRTRAAKDMERTKVLALENFMTSFFPVLDSMEKALEYQDSNSQGIKMILDITWNVLKKFTVEQIAPAAGEDFNPDLHEAIGLQESTVLPHNTIFQVIQPGYFLGSKILRAARVIVINNITMIEG